MGQARNINIDGFKLKKLIIAKADARNITEACEILGIAGSTISDAYLTNRISSKTSNMLENHGIYLCDYISDVALPVRKNSKECKVKRLSNTLLIDKDKFRNILTDKTGTFRLSDISIELGFGATYISQVSIKEAIPKSLAILLESKYGISYDEYKKEEPCEEIADTSEIDQNNDINNSDIQDLKNEISLMKDLIFKLGQINMDILNEIKELRNDWRN